MSAAGGADVRLLGVLHDAGVKVVNLDVVGETTAGEGQEACLCGVVVLDLFRSSLVSRWKMRDHLYTVLVNLDVSGLVDLFV